MLPEIQISLLQAQVKSLQQQLAAHTDIKSREMYVRRQETSLKELIQNTENVLYYERLMKLIDKSVILQEEWLRFKTFCKLFSEPEDIALMEDFFSAKN
jgi:chromosome condensin MukBEF MukE localization factor